MLTDRAVVAGNDREAGADQGRYREQPDDRPQQCPGMRADRGDQLLPRIQLKRHASIVPPWSTRPAGRPSDPYRSAQVDDISGGERLDLAAEVDEQLTIGPDAHGLPADRGAVG
ncbi:hypothetical protein SDC9_105073 [bioreactor metagenome]|uniref:Uncharacterized protein n=1 Tax=bioreactor metagenome TaxID=1076179 RepID=A0A645AY94_9ZZZZ